MIEIKLLILSLFFTIITHDLLLEFLKYKHRNNFLFNYIIGVNCRPCFAIRIAFILCLFFFLLKLANAHAILYIPITNFLIFKFTEK